MNPRDPQQVNAKIQQDAELETISRIFEKFVEDIQKLEKTHGEEEIQRALSQAFPDMEDVLAEIEEDEKLLSEAAVPLLTRLASAAPALKGALASAARFGKEGVGTAWNVIKYLGRKLTPTGRAKSQAIRSVEDKLGPGAISGVTGLPKTAAAKKMARELGLLDDTGKLVSNAAFKSGKFAPTAAGAATGGGGLGWKGTAALMAGDAVTDFAAQAGGKRWDQDVAIAKIATDDFLNVKSSELADLLKQTNDAIKNLAQVMGATREDLSSQLGNIDRNQDDLLGAQLGMTGREVTAQQNVRGTITPPPEEDEEQRPPVRVNLPTGPEGPSMKSPGWKEVDNPRKKKS